MEHVSPDILMLIIKVLLSLLGSIVVLTLAVIGIIYRGAMKRLDNLDVDLKPLVIKMGIQEEQIKEVKEKLVENTQWLNQHDERLQRVERLIKT